MSTNQQLRADHVCSLLRTEAIKEARAKHAASDITDHELKEIENVEIEKIIAKQVELGYQVVTDGEFRRAWYYLDFFTGCEGIDVIKSNPLVFNNNVETNLINFTITGKIKLSDHQYIE